MVAAPPIERIGEQARRALERSGGIAEPLAAMADSPYMSAGGEIVWIGARLPAMHPRAVVLAGRAARDVALRFERIPSVGWSPPPPKAGRARRLAKALQRLRPRLFAQQAPRGLGALLAGGEPEFPLAAAAPRVRALARAYASGEAGVVLEASVALLGLGTGLTPSGDDLVGAALFARRLTKQHDAAWSALAGRLCSEVAVRSHPVSAALFADLARGESFAPLHELVATLAEGDDAGALDAALRLVALGHSSGWDMLAGFYLGTDPAGLASGDGRAR